MKITAKENYANVIFADVLLTSATIISAFAIEGITETSAKMLFYCFLWLLFSL